MMSVRREKRYRLYPKKDPIIFKGPTKWIYTTIKHPWIKNKMVSTAYLVIDADKPEKRMFTLC